MSDNIRGQERTELHNTIWKLANELRGSVDGWDFKQYVLGFLFYRYISENIVNYINKGEHEAGNADFTYLDLKPEEAETIRAEMVEEKGFFILPEDTFQKIADKVTKSVKAESDKLSKGEKVEEDDLDTSLNEMLQKIFKRIEQSAVGSQSEENFKGLFDDIDVNSNKLGPTVVKRNKRLKKIITTIAGMNLGDYQNNSIDAFGDAYEYLMGMYASAAGKSGGEFFTPQEVSELLTRIALVGTDGKQKRKLIRYMIRQWAAVRCYLISLKFLGKKMLDRVSLVKK